MRRLSKIISIFLVFKGALACAAENADQILNQFCEMKNTGAPACAYHRKNTESQEVNWKTFFSRQKCDELFSAEPPDWIKADPRSGIFTRAANWGSVCTLSQLEQERRKHPNLGRAERVAQLSNYYLHEMDACAAPKNDRYSVQFSMPSQQSSKVKSMNADQRTQRAADFKRIQAQSSAQCCKDDQECLEKMKSVELVFCKSEPDPAKPDPCVGQGTYYHAEFDQNWYQKALAQKEAGTTGRVDVSASDLLPGAIVISPFMGEDSDHDYFHELGHACNQIKRKLAIRRGSASALEEYLETESCQISSAGKKTYLDLFTENGMDEKTAGCLTQTALRASSARFSAKPCENGCPNKAIGETHAVAFGLLATPNSDWLTKAIPWPVCYGMRDSRHALSADVVQCLLFTPQLRTRFETATGCLK